MLQHHLQHFRGPLLTVVPLPGAHERRQRDDRRGPIRHEETDDPVSQSEPIPVFARNLKARLGKTHLAGVGEILRGHAIGEHGDRHKHDRKAVRRYGDNSPPSPSPPGGSAGRRSPPTPPVARCTLYVPISRFPLPGRHSAHLEPPPTGPGSRASGRRTIPIVRFSATKYIRARRSMSAADALSRASR